MDALAGRSGRAGIAQDEVGLVPLNRDRGGRRACFPVAECTA